jgi:CRP/FNR family transcriptional regulator, cyclic AMP receptor protein
MIQRFQGEHGRRKLISALQEQKIVQNNEALASEIADASELRLCKQGDILTTQGSDDTAIFFIICGSVSIIVNGREITQRKEGHHVGEMALIDPTARRAATLCVAEETVVAVMTEADFTALAEKYPHLWRRLALEIAHRLRERNKHVKPPNSAPEIFVGSSVERLEIARQIQVGLERDAEVTLWTDGVFEASSTTIEDLLAQVARSDFAVLVIGEEDTLVSRDVETPAPRDNVIFELGLFMGELGRARSFIVKERGSKTKIPSDLLGLNLLEYNRGEEHTLPGRMGAVCTAIRRRVKELGAK